MSISKPLDIFCEIPCLTENTTAISGITLQKKWFKTADKRILGQYLQKFINYNSRLFNFLKISPQLIGTDQNISIKFSTSQFIGSIPLRSPDNGKQIGDFVVTPRFTGKDRYEEYIEILDLLGTEINPQIIDSLPLASGRNFRPPLYLEAVKFISALEILIRNPWRKFNREEKKLAEPVGQVNWNKYIQNEYKIENRLRFPLGKNILNEFHLEYSQIKYVFNLCKAELLSSNTPLRIKLNIKPRINFLDEKLYRHIPSRINLIPIKNSDGLAVKNCKLLANKILNFNFTDSTAWRVDFANVFEKFVQYIFKEVVKESGGRLLENYKIKGYSKKHFAWELSHIEPDAILQKEDLIIFIDAKYKSHLYNKHNTSEKLKEEHRNDLHQILAYSSFSKFDLKFGILCYPSQEVEIKEITYQNPINKTESKIIIFGLPLKRSIVNEAKRYLLDYLPLK